MSANKGSNRVIWEQWQVDFIRDNFHAMTARQLSDATGMALKNVRIKYYGLGLKKMKMQYWTTEQVRFLEDNYSGTGDTELSEMFSHRWAKDKGWSKKHIEKKRRYLGLKRTPEEKKAIHKRNTGKGYFEKCPVRAWETRGVAPVGEIRIRKNARGRTYKVIKTKDGFVHYAPWLYAQAYGPVPRGRVVRLRDGNPENVTEGNLMLITRGQNAILNSRNRDTQLTVTRKIIHQINKKIKINEKQTHRPEQPPVCPTRKAE